MLKYQRVLVGMLESNSYVLRDESGALALIDCGVFSRPLREAITSAGGDLRYILLTHGHFDHTQGVPAAKEAFPAARVCIGAQDAPFLRGERSVIPGRHTRETKMEPDVLLQEGDVIPVGGSGLRVISAPGHSPGGVCFLSGADGLLFTGDTLFREEVGRDDLPGGDWAALVASIRRLYALEGDYDVLPGHGPASSLEHERGNNPYVRN